MMEFIDLKAIHERSREAIEAGMAGVLEHGRFINGPEVYELESALGEFLGGTHCILTSSGTMALEIALRALGIGPGDEVITTPFTWISTAEVIGLVGARPVFADIDPETFNIDPGAARAAITEKTKAIIPVNLFGQMADYESLGEIVAGTGIHLIEDAAQSFGAKRNGRKSGTVGTVSCTSFFPAKPLGCYGDGGAVFTRDPDLADSMRAIVNHGGLVRGEHDLLGTNGRCDTLQAAILLAKLPAFKEEIGMRQELGQRYSRRLAEKCQIPAIDAGNMHIYAQYTIRPRNREALAEELKSRGIPAAVYYRKCLHQQKIFEPLGYPEGSFPHAEAAAAEVLSLPFHPYMGRETQDLICNAILESKHA